jgi:hypothetical protein
MGTRSGEDGNLNMACVDAPGRSTDSLEVQLGYLLLPQRGLSGICHPFGNSTGAVCDRKTNRFFVRLGKNPWQDTWV